MCGLVYFYSGNDFEYKSPAVPSKNKMFPPVDPNEKENNVRLREANLCKYCLVNIDISISYEEAIAELVEVRYMTEYRDMCAAVGIPHAKPHHNKSSTQTMLIPWH